METKKYAINTRDLVHLYDGIKRKIKCIHDIPF